MLKSVTRKISDESAGDVFRFTFYCDICGKPWHSVPFKSDLGLSRLEADNDARAKEHTAAYERANREALGHFNRCPTCLRMVCDSCFPNLEECAECAEARKREYVK